MPRKAKTAVKDAPIANGVNGRTSNGQFAIGNQGGPGNPNNLKCAEFRSQLVAVGEKRLPKILSKLFDLAESGEQWAMEQVLDRLLGKVREVEPEAGQGAVVNPIQVLVQALTQQIPRQPVGEALMIEGQNGK